MEHLKKIAIQFNITGKIKEIRTLSGGFINTTYLVETEDDAPDYILQKKNGTIFKDVPAMMDNIVKVTNHIRNKVVAAGGNPDREVMTVIPTLSGEYAVCDENGDYWTMSLYIPDTITHDRGDSPEMAYKGGEGIGKFQMQLSDFNEPLSETIPGFHNLRFRFEQWDKSLEADKVHRKESVKKEIEWIESRREQMMKFWQLVENGVLPRRVTHNDTKLSNILFDKNDNALCVIDLDTVMSNTVLADYGDAIRSFANTGAEDDENLDNVSLNMEIFKAYTRGFLSKTASALTPEELKYLPFGALYITFEQVLRFLMDYIDGDTYYHTDYPEHNLVRTHAQQRLMESMEDNFQLMVDFCESLTQSKSRKKESFKRLLIMIALFFSQTFINASVVNKCDDNKVVEEFANVIEIFPNDDSLTIRKKAAYVVPTPVQAEALEDDFAAFIHFGPNTFTGKEWGDGFEDVTLFNPTAIDARQWVSVLKDAGVKKIILTVKHHDGYVLWQSRYTNHGIMGSPYMNGNADVFRELALACADLDMKLGVYLSPADLYQIESPGGLYGNGSRRTLRQIPAPADNSRPFYNSARFYFVTDDYNEYFMSQLYELLTEYGPIYEVWFDGANPKEKGGQTYDYPAWVEMIRQLAPQAVIFGGGDVRWCGNEAGRTRDNEWNVVPYMTNPDSIVGFDLSTHTDIGSMEKLIGARYLHYLYPETDTSIREGWFYRDENQGVRSADDIFDIYERAVGGNSVLLLNVPPDKDGRFGERDVAALVETGRRIKETYDKNLLEKSDADAILLDNDWTTGIPVDKQLTIGMQHPVMINRIVLQEDVPDSGERVEHHTMEAYIDGQWKKVTEAGNIGHRRILRFPDIVTDSIRIIIDSSRETPVISTLSAHYYSAPAPALQAKRIPGGKVVVYPARSNFQWKNSIDNSTENLSAGTIIRYTVDGSDPDSLSAIYEGPFDVMDFTMVKAYSELNGKKGDVMMFETGVDKSTWTSTDYNSSRSEVLPNNAFDYDEKSVWIGNDINSPLTIYFGKSYDITRVDVTPPTSVGENGLITAGRIETSTNGIDWIQTASFEFGNILNDPTTRRIDFKCPVNASYLRVVPTNLTGGVKPSIAEISIY